MLFSRDKNESEKPKQSMAGFLLKPDIGGSIRPIGESVSMFVRLIAMIFASSGLFPKNHPALTGALPMNDPSARLTLMQVVSTGWNSFSFTKEDLPKALMFFAFVGTMGIGVVILFMFLMSLMSGTAHAQSMFVPTDTTNDLAHNWIGYLFRSQPMQNLLINSAGYSQATQDQAIQTAMRGALAFYSTAILVVAGLVLLYHLTHMVAETAHTGKVMGNANQIWAPIRLVFAIGLLIPIGDAGLNTGQYIMVQMAEWGSGLASNTWQRFSTVIAQRNATVIPPPAPQVASVVQSLALSHACMYAYNYYLGQGNGGVSLVFGPGADETVRQHEFNGDSYRIVEFGNNLDGQRSICGRYEFSLLTTGGSRAFPSINGNAADYDRYDMQKVQQIYNAIINAFNATETAVASMAQQQTQHIIASIDGSGTVNIPQNSSFRSLVQQFSTQLQTNIASIFNNQSNSTTSTNLANEWSALGWVAAGAWFNTISRTQGNVINATRDALPNVSPPTLLSAGVFSGSGGGTNDTVLRTGDVLREFSSWMAQGYPNTPVTQEDIRRWGTDAQVGAPNFVGKSGILDSLMSIVDSVGRDIGFWKFRIGATANPLAELADSGHKSLFMAFDTLDKVISWGGALDAATKAVASGSATSVEAFLKSDKAKAWAIPSGILGLLANGTNMFIMMMASIAVLFASVFFTVGVTLGFIIPLLPFTLFFFNTLAWAVSLFEAVVSMPLWALAHLTTKGEGIHGDMGKQGYFFIFSIFLRPVLMVLGLVAGLLIFYVAIAILNMTYSIAAQGSGSWGVDKSSFNTLSKVILEVIYAIFAYICANTSFKTINFFPEHAMRWMSSQGVATERMGDKGIMNQATQAFTAYGFKESIGSMVSRSPAVAFGFRSLVGGPSGGGGAAGGTPNPTLGGNPSTGFGSTSVSGLSANAAQQPMVATQQPMAQIDTSAPAAIQGGSATTGPAQVASAENESRSTQLTQGSDQSSTTQGRAMTPERKVAQLTAQDQDQPSSQNKKEA